MKTVSDPVFSFMVIMSTTVRLSMKASLSLPHTLVCSMWLTSNREQWVLVCWWLASAPMSLYWTGMLYPAWQQIMSI